MADATSEVAERARLAVLEARPSTSNEQGDDGRRNVRMISRVGSEPPGSGTMGCYNLGMMLRLTRTYKHFLVDSFYTFFLLYFDQ